MDELRAAIHKARDSATGPDHIHYQMLKNLPDVALDTLLRVFKDSWTTGHSPRAWSEATIIPSQNRERTLELQTYCTD